MTLRMGDGPIANLPAGLDAYAGYTDNSGIGVTFPGVVAKFPAAKHLSISVHGQAPADVGDVENGALASWKGYTVGYCAISNAQALINRDGRPQKLWTAHYTNTPHICNPSCGFGFTGTADGTQWTDHGGVWDESLLSDTFFSTTKDVQMLIYRAPNGAEGTFSGTAMRGIDPAVSAALVAAGVPVVTIPQVDFDAIPIENADPAAAALTAVQALTATVNGLVTTVNALANAVAKIPTTSPAAASLKGETATITFS